MYHIVPNLIDHSPEHMNKNVSLCGEHLDWHIDFFVTMKANPNLKNPELCPICKDRALLIVKENNA